MASTSPGTTSRSVNWTHPPGPIRKVTSSTFGGRPIPAMPSVDQSLRDKPADNPATANSGPAGLLRAYFGSGWAFLIPYLAVYLLYAWLRWPVNAGATFAAPPLLHVFWFLHG